MGKKRKNKKGKKQMETLALKEEKDFENFMNQIEQPLIELHLAQSNLVQCLLLMKTGSDFLPEQKEIRTGVLEHLYNELQWQNEKLEQILEKFS